MPNIMEENSSDLNETDDDSTPDDPTTIRPVDEPESFKKIILTIIICCILMGLIGYMYIKYMAPHISSK